MGWDAHTNAHTIHAHALPLHTLPHTSGNGRPQLLRLGAFNQLCDLLSERMVGAALPSAPTMLAPCPGRRCIHPPACPPHPCTSIGTTYAYTTTYPAPLTTLHQLHYATTRPASTNIHHTTYTHPPCEMLPNAAGVWDPGQRARGRDARGAAGLHSTIRGPAVRLPGRCMGMSA